VCAEEPATGERPAPVGRGPLDLPSGGGSRCRAELLGEVFANVGLAVHGSRANRLGKAVVLLLFLRRLPGIARSLTAYWEAVDMDRQRKILVVDDDPDIVESIKMVLEANSFKVATGGSAEEGLALARSEKPDLMLLDVMMPTGTEGFEVVWELRADPDPAIKNIPIVMLTAIHGTTELRFYPEESDTTYQAGEYLPVQGFIDKPVEPRALLSQIDKLLHKA